MQIGNIFMTSLDKDENTTIQPFVQIGFDIEKKKLGTFQNNISNAFIIKPLNRPTLNLKQIKCGAVVQFCGPNAIDFSPFFQIS